MPDAELLRSFRFRVTLSGEGYTKDGESEPEDAAFAECSGIKVVNHVLRMRSGADERGAQGVVPATVEYSNLTLTRGVTFGNRFLDWVFSCFPTFESGANEKKAVRKTIHIVVLTEEGKEGVAWDLYGAYPVSYSLGNMSSLNSGVLMESIEFAYSGFERRAPGEEELKKKLANANA